MYKQIAQLNGCYDSLFKSHAAREDRVEGMQLFLGFCLYLGEFLDCAPHGQGCFFCADLTLEGEWRCGQFAQGSVRWRSGARYTGTMCPANDYYWAKGSLHLQCGAVLVAEWDGTELVEGRLLVRERSLEVRFVEGEGPGFTSTATQFKYSAEGVTVQVQKFGYEVVEYWPGEAGAQMRALYKGVHLFYLESVGAQGDRLKSDLRLGVRISETRSRTLRTMWFARGVRVDVALPEEKATVSFPVFGDHFELNSATRFLSSQQPAISGFYVYKMDEIDYAIKTLSLDELFKHSVILGKISFKEVLAGLLRAVDGLAEFLTERQKAAEKAAQAAKLNKTFSSRKELLKEDPVILDLTAQPRNLHSFNFCIAVQRKKDKSETVDAFFGCIAQGKYEGFCEVSFADGGVYRGFFSRGLKQGYGVSTTDQGEMLLGSYDRNEPMGSFKRVRARGEIETGIIETGKFVRTHSAKIGAVRLEGVLADSGLIEGTTIVHFVDGSKLKCLVSAEKLFSQPDVVYFAADSTSYVGELRIKEKMGFFAGDDVLVSINLSSGVTEILS